MTTNYGDISPRTAGKAMFPLLERMLPYLVYETWGTGKPLSTNSTKTAKFRRYEALDNDPANNTLTEGVTPALQGLTYTDYEATLKQMGGVVGLSDVVLDTHEDPVLQEAIDLISEQAAQTVERDRIGNAIAGTNVFYANGTARNQVNTTLTRDLQRRITRGLEAQNCRLFTKAIRSTPNYGTVGVKPSYVAICHSDLDSVIRDMEGFKDPIDYGSGYEKYPNEIGSVEKVRYFTTTLQGAWEDAGGTVNGMISTGAANANVYPIVYLSMDAFGLVPLKGKNSLVPMVVNPKPSDSDPLAQRAKAGWKSMQTSLILNDLWMARAEVAVPA